MATDLLAPIHPGTVLREEFMEPLDISQNMLARALGVSPRRINDIVHGRRSITADTALRLARFFDMTPGFWLNLQKRYDLDVAEDALRDRLSTEVQTLAELRAA